MSVLWGGGIEQMPTPPSETPKQPSEGNEDGGREHLQEGTADFDKAVNELMSKGYPEAEAIEMAKSFFKVSTEEPRYPYNTVN